LSLQKIAANKNIDRLSLVLQLIDSRVGPTADDEMMMSFMRQAQIPFIIVATKTDKLNATEKKNNLEAIAAHPLAEGTQVIAFSSLKNIGKDELWRAILACANV
jgi:GTP-binding protein